MERAYRREEGSRNPGAILAIALPVLLAVALRLPFLAAPLERDEGEYAYIAWRMAHGGVPYLDTFDQKPPGIFAVYWLAFTLFGRRVESVRLLLALWGAAATALAALLGRRFGRSAEGFQGAGDLAALATGTAFALLSTAPTLWATAANTELFMLLPLLGAAALAFPAAEAPATAQPGRLTHLIAIGALLAAAFLFKQVAAFAGIALLPFLLAGGRLGAQPWWKRLAALAGGGLAVLAPVVLAFAAAGALQPFLDCVLLHNVRYAGSGCASWSLPFLRYELGRMAAAHWPAFILALGGAVAAARSRRPAWRFTLLWLAAGLGSAGLGCRFFPHYFLAAVPPLALLAGLGTARLAGWAGRHGGRAGGLAAALALLLVVAVPLTREAGLFLWMSPGARSHAIYGPEIFPGARALGEHIRAETRPGDKVFVLGSEPEVLFHAERQSATRYIFFDPLLGSFPDALARQREALDEVARAHPAAVLFVRHPNSLGAPPDDASPVIRGTRDLLKAGYALDGALFLVPDGTLLALGPAELAALPPQALRRAAALLYLRERTPVSAVYPAG